jgi:light-regulated signal transduction histidine kinase (bacteriophytochrome)
MGLLIDHLLSLSRSARQDVLRASVDVSAAAESVIAELRSATPERRVETIVQPHMVADADATLLEMILVNLLGNAWKFTAKHESARIEVGVADTDGEHTFFVKDDGAGFDPDHAEHLFGPFQRLHSTAEFEGDGIGLATVQRLVARHGGRVWAEAQVEKGATFYFTLPARV